MATTAYPPSRRTSSRGSHSYKNGMSGFQKPSTPVNLAAQIELHGRPNTAQTVYGRSLRMDEEDNRQSGTDFDWEDEENERIMDLSMRKEARFSDLPDVSYGVEDGMEDLVQIPIAPELMSRRQRSKSQLRSRSSRSMGNLPSVASREQFYPPYNSQFSNDRPTLSRSSSRASSLAARQTGLIGLNNSSQTSLPRSVRRGSESEVQPYFANGSKSRLPVRSKPVTSYSEDESAAGLGKRRGKQRASETDEEEVTFPSDGMDMDDEREMLEGVTGSEDERGSRKRLSSALDLTEFGPPQTKRKVVSDEPEEVAPPSQPPKKAPVVRGKGKTGAAVVAKGNHSYPPRSHSIKRSTTAPLQTFPSSNSTSSAKPTSAPRPTDAPAKPRVRAKTGNMGTAAPRVRTPSSANKSGTTTAGNRSVSPATKRPSTTKRPVVPRAGTSNAVPRRRSFSTSSINHSSDGPSAPFSASPPIIYKAHSPTNSVSPPEGGQSVKPSWDDVVLPAVARKMHREWQEEQAQKGGDALIRDWDKEGRPAGMELVIVNGKKVLRRVESKAEEQKVSEETVPVHVEDNRTLVGDGASTMRERDVETPSTAVSGSLKRNKSVLRPDGQIVGLGERKEVWQRNSAAIPEVAVETRLEMPAEKVEKDDKHGGGCCRCTIM
ncbi:hypothetical protein BT69DRAFT_1335102 [Atractiella rhizophila]|nr:hypothetical protein BT69DRAFT_1335102 [Atractiella rhizophila]